MLEVEAKFQVLSSRVFDTIRAKKQGAGYDLTHPRRMRQRDTYFDTATGWLFEHDRSFRLREKHGTYVLTFKRQLNGNRVRQELETPISASQAAFLFNGDFAKMPVEAVNAALSATNGKPLSPVLHVENTREAWDLHSEGGRVKICFDTIRYIREGESQCIAIDEYELELELQSGDERVLRKLVQAVLTQHLLIENTDSKYERGVALLNVFTPAG